MLPLRKTNTPTTSSDSSETCLLSNNLHHHRHPNTRHNGRCCGCHPRRRRDRPRRRRRAQIRLQRQHVLRRLLGRRRPRAEEAGGYCLPFPVLHHLPPFCTSANLASSTQASNPTRSRSTRRRRRSSPRSRCRTPRCSRRLPRRARRSTAARPTAWRRVLRCRLSRLCTRAGG